MKAVGTFFVFCFLAFAGCGGGGGGDSESSGKSSGKSASTGVRILHAAIDLPPVFSSSSTSADSIIEQVRFNETSIYGELPTGDQVVRVQTLGASSESFSFPVTVEKGQRRSVLIYGTRDIFGIHAALLEDFPPELSSGTSAIRIVHGLAGAAALKGSVGGNSLSSPIGFGEASNYIEVPAGPVEVSLARNADGKSVLSATPILDAGTSYTIVITGEVGYIIFSNFLADG